MSETRFEEIFLTEMANFNPQFGGQIKMVIEDQPHRCRPGHLQDCLSQLSNFILRCLLATKLDQVRTAIAQLPSHGRSIAARQICGIHKRIKATIGKRLHQQLKEDPKTP